VQLVADRPDRDLAHGGLLAHRDAGGGGDRIRGLSRAPHRAGVDRDQVELGAAPRDRGGLRAAARAERVRFVVVVDRERLVRLRHRVGVAHDVQLRRAAPQR
jgi:hypothetical protein